MSKNYGQNQEIYFAQRFDQFKKLTKEELSAMLDKTDLSKRERDLIQSILTECSVVWKSKNGSTVIERVNAETDFVMRHKCIGGVVEEGFVNYEDAVANATWLCGEKT